MLYSGLVGRHVAMNALISVDESSEFFEQLFVAGELLRESVERISFAKTSGDLALGAADAAWHPLDLLTRLLVFR